jgi:hypothetical protein
VAASGDTATKLPLLLTANLALKDAMAQRRVLREIRRFAAA